MTRFADYTAATESGHVDLEWRHELITPEGDLLATTDYDLASGDTMLWGCRVDPLRWQANRVSQRTTRATVLGFDEPLVPTNLASPLHPATQNRVRTWAGYTRVDGTVDWHIQSTLLVQRPVATLNEHGSIQTQVNLVDVTSILRSQLIAGFEFDQGETVEAVAARLAATVYNQDLAMASTGFDTPSGSLEAGAQIYGTIDALLSGCGHELVATADGMLISGPIPPAGLEVPGSQWLYGEGGIPIHWAQREWQTPTPQGWRIVGGTARETSISPTITIYDRDPSSLGYFTGVGVVHLGETRLPYVRSISQAVAAAYGQLRRNGIGPLVLKFHSVPNPALRQGDLLQVRLPALDVDHICRVMAYQLPQQADGLMEITVRAVYEPDLGYEPPVDRSTGFLEAIADTFDRSDRNLENINDPIGSDPGSLDWTEVGYSWGIVSGVAVQRFANGWSLAYVNTPLGSSNQFAEIKVATIPNGRRIGPAVRCSGEFAGYVALMDQNGIVSLEAWQNGQRVQVLGATATGSSPDNRVVRITADGSTITVAVGGQDILSATDNRYSGSHVGMVGYGGHGPVAPGADEFQAGTV